MVNPTPARLLSQGVAWASQTCPGPLACACPRPQSSARQRTSLFPLFCPLLQHSAAARACCSQPRWRVAAEHLVMSGCGSVGSCSSVPPSWPSAAVAVQHGAPRHTTLLQRGCAAMRMMLSNGALLWPQGTCDAGVVGYCRCVATRQLCETRPGCGGLVVFVLQSVGVGSNGRVCAV